MFPMKFCEYLAAGLPVVSTQIDFARGPLPGLKMGSTPLDFAKAIQSQLAIGRLSPAASRAAVGENTWAARMHSMMKILLANQG
jgi:hypothetical protein